MELLNRLAAALQKGVRTLSPNCREASRLQAEALECPLLPAQRFGLRVHLLLCKWCRRYGKQIRFLRQAGTEHRDELTETASRGLSPESRERLKRSSRGKPK